jgi:hypothetical protein
MSDRGCSRNCGRSTILPSFQHLDSAHVEIVIFLTPSCQMVLAIARFGTRPSGVYSETVVSPPFAGTETEWEQCMITLTTSADSERHNYVRATRSIRRDYLW